MKPTKILGGDAANVNNPQINRIENPAIKTKKRKSDTKLSIAEPMTIPPEIQPVAPSADAPTNIFSWFGTGIANVGTGIANAATTVGTGIANTATTVGTGISNAATNTVDVFSSKPIENGKKIFAKYYYSGKFTGKWYPAVINDMAENGMYNIRYYDNVYVDLPINDIRVVHRGITLDKEQYFNKLYNYASEVDNQKKLSGLGVANTATDKNCSDAANIIRLEIKNCSDYKNEINTPEVQKYFRREKIYRFYQDGVTSDELNAKLYGGKSCKQRKSHKNNKTRKNRKSRKQRK